MTEILTTGLKGLYNRINLFSTVMQNDVIDVTMFIDKNKESLSGSSQASNNVMLATRTENMMFGKNISPEQFLDILSRSRGKIIEKKEYESLKRKYHPEFNTTTDKIGDEYRKIGNMVMLLSRADFYIKNGHDLFPYEYIQMLLNNGAML